MNNKARIMIDGMNKHASVITNIGKIKPKKTFLNKEVSKLNIIPGGAVAIGLAAANA